MQTFTLKERIHGFIYLMHPLPSTIGTLYMLLGVYLASDWATLWAATTLRPTLAVFLTISFSFVINDYRDIEVDSIAKPDRPLPSGRVTPREAVILMAILLLLILSLTLTFPSTVWWLVALNLILAAAYSLYLKNTLLLGNMTIAFLDASTILFGAMLVGTITTKIWIGFMLIFLFVMAQEILFAAQDYEGDSQAALQTTANRLGKENTLRLFKGLALLFAVTALWPTFIQIASWQYMVAAIVCTIIPILTAVGMLTWKVTPRTIWFSTRIVVLLWLTSFLPLMLLK